MKLSKFENLHYYTHLLLTAGVLHSNQEVLFQRGKGIHRGRITSSTNYREGSNHFRVDIMYQIEEYRTGIEIGRIAVMCISDDLTYVPMYKNADDYWILPLG